MDGSSGGVFTRLQLPPSSYPDLTLTISAWAKINGPTADSCDQAVVACFDAYEGGYWPGFGYNNDGDWFIQVGNNSVDTEIPADIGGGWHNVVVVYTPTEAKFYCDGSLAYTYTSSPAWGSYGGSSGNLTIGYDATGSHTEGSSDDYGFNWFNGEINEVDVWSSALSESDGGVDDIAALYNSGIGITSGYPQHRA